MNIDLKELRQITQGDKRARSRSFVWLGYIVHRDISLIVTYGILKLFPRVTPNAVSIAMILLGLLGVAFISVGTIGCAYLGILLVYFSFILDKTDGEIARYKNIESVRGMYFDEVYHILVTVGAYASFFMYYAYNAGFVSVVVFTTTTVLIVYRRYIRKMFHLILVKKRHLNIDELLNLQRNNEGAAKYLHGFLFKTTSIVERFDLFIFLLLLLTIALQLGHDFYEYVFVGYFVLSLVHIIRWTIIQILMSGYALTDLKKD